MDYAKSIICSLLIFGIVHGCAQKQKNKIDPTKLPLASDIKSTVHRIGVLPLHLRGTHTAILMRDKQYLKSIAGGAGDGAGGALHDAVFVDPYAILALPFGIVVGAVYGAAHPNEVDVIPTHAQIESFGESVEGAFLSLRSEEKKLQDILVKELGKHTSSELYPVYKNNGQIETSVDISDETRPSLDAMLFSSVRNISLSGYASDDPVLSIKIDFSIFLTNAGKPKQCLGWYGGVWEGETRLFSEWQKDKGRHLKDEIEVAYREMMPKAMNYLFNTPIAEGRVVSRALESSLAYCNISESRHILKQAIWFCPQADKGIADPQRRIGDTLYYGNSESGERDYAGAYVWYSLAAKGNNTEAKARLLELEKELTSEQLHQGQRRLESWNPGDCIKDLSEIGHFWSGYK